VIGPYANPTAVTTDDTNVYMGVLGNGATKGQVLSAPLTTGPATVLADNQAQPRGVAVDAVHVYWTNGGGGTVMRIAKDGSDNKVPTIMASGGIEPLGIAIDATTVYWADDKLNTVQKVAK
jgi:DNA-binding beta-propeller fold protein YncE